MLSRLQKGFLYTDVGTGITENDLDTVADTWEIDQREVYRGTRDPRYTHANVHWLYDDNLERTGCVEHSVQDHADFRVLWFRDNEFGTLFQEDWESRGDIWSLLPRSVFDRFVNEEWTTPKAFLEQCLYGPTRILTPSMVLKLPTVYTCEACGRKSLDPVKGCVMTEAPLDFPDKAKIFFVDEDFLVYSPPSDSQVWLTQQPQPDGGSSEPVQEQEQEQASLPSSEPRSPPDDPPPAQLQTPEPPAGAA